ncbi:transketolase [Thioalkalivibrio sp. XN279]|uniref:transketolase n=1 Tax=Thioalkalivibrio sp. XN279 TaxID=2714953 RepID=UPI00140E2BCA|nr:transketolase [Thioalkalivibrio sp. XN279]NHA16111.1 transketolase [Thioalkalivibrio sp. XN279]
MPSRRDLANAIRALSMDAVQQANSGHPGMPMGMADIAEVLWNDFLRHNPGNPHWPNRDRFVVSNGHGSMLLYSLLHLSGYPLEMDEIRNFRQFGSRTAGHPEYEPEMGVETTTGPLGQGLANAVGMAIAERVLAAHYNRPGFELIDHHTWVFTGDGCLMEGVSHEACSLAGTLGLGKLIVFYDDNGISIDGEVEGWFTDDTPARFEAYGWHVVPGVDGHDPEAVKAAIEAAKAETGRPTLICCRTVIGWGAPNKEGTEATHGAALGADEVAATRKNIGWPHDPFVIPEDIRAAWDGRERGAAAEAAWAERMAAYAREYPQQHAELQRRLAGELPAGWDTAADEAVAALATSDKAVATRKASEMSLDAFGPMLPELIGGSADLSGSNNTFFKGSRRIAAGDFAGNYLHYGVREFGMTAIMNGLALHGGFKPYGGTFLVFSDYARNAVRMAALMRQPVTLVYTHDSIGLGEDGPTHQPIEHLASLRLIPNLRVWRPCDLAETAVAWRDAIESRSTPTVLALSRQNLPPQARSAQQLAAIRRGGYVLHRPAGEEHGIIIASGSEVALAVAAATALADEGIGVRVVSMPCIEAFRAQDAAWRQEVLPAAIKARLAVEAGVPDSWYPFVGDAGDVVGMEGFGASAPAGALFEHFGFTAAHVAAKLKALL